MVILELLWQRFPVFVHVSIKNDALSIEFVSFKSISKHVKELQVALF